MASVLRHSPSKTSPIQNGNYSTKYRFWKGYVDRHALLNTIFEARADSAFASWKTQGNEAATQAKILDNWNGTGKETFKSIIKNNSTIADVCGDSYGEIIIDDIPDVADDVPANLITLDADSIQQEIKNGRIVKYFQTNNKSQTGKNEWKPEEIMHFVTGRMGASTHGTSMLEPLQNILLHKEQLLLTGSKLFELYIQPMTLVPLKTDVTRDMTTFKNQWNTVNQTDTKVLFYSADMVEGEIKRVGVPEGSTLDPAKWVINILDAEILKRFRTTEVLLGTATVNSEESARYQFTGFRQTVRSIQGTRAEELREQIFKLAYPEDPPKIKFSFATEAPEEEWNRNFTAAQFYAQGAQAGDPMSQLLYIKKLIEMGEIPNA